MNADPQFVRYKTLVGFEAVFSDQWEDTANEFDYEAKNRFRLEEAQRFVDCITDENKAEWLSFIEKCASTKSNDGATFPIFTSFLTTLSQNKPHIAEWILEQASAYLLGFLASFLDGLFRSKAKKVYQSRIERVLSEATHLVPLMRHWRSSKPGRKLFLSSVLTKAISVADDVAVNESVLFAIEAAGTEAAPRGAFLTRALAHLNSRKDARWVRVAWFAAKPTAFFESLTDDDARLLLDNLLHVPKIEHIQERILAGMAQKHLSLVWDWLGQRLFLKRLEGRDDDIRYEAIPYQFHGLEKHLARDPGLAVTKVRAWFQPDSDESALFRFLGGRLLSIAFPQFRPEFATELSKLITNGDLDDAKFVMAIMENHHGETATHDVLKLAIDTYPRDESVLSGVTISFDSTGVLDGELGYAEALREKKALMETWLTDARPNVQKFAAGHIKSLGLRIAEEQRRGEDRTAFRRLRYNADDADASK
jgi:hypothetical protein